MHTYGSIEDNFDTQQFFLITRNRFILCIFLYEGYNEIYADAGEEGVTYGDGVSLPEREPDSIMALNGNTTVNFVGFAGHMHFIQPSSESDIRSNPLIRVDYGRYAAGDEYFIIQYRMVKQQFFLSDINYR